MYSTRLQIPGMALAVWCAACVLTLATPKAMRAESRAQTAETAREVSDACVEPYRPLFIVQSFGADRHAPEPHVAPSWQPEALARAELQVPAALWRTLLMEKEMSRSIDLHVPAALQATLAAEGRLQLPQRSHNPWTPFCSSY